MPPGAVWALAATGLLQLTAASQLTTAKVTVLPCISLPTLFTRARQAGRQAGRQALFDARESRYNIDEQEGWLCAWIYPKGRGGIIEVLVAATTLHTKSHVSYVKMFPSIHLLG